MKWNIQQLLFSVAILAVAMAVYANWPTIHENGIYRALETRDSQGVGYNHLLDFHNDTFYYHDKCIDSASDHYRAMMDFPLLVDRGTYEKRWSRIKFSTDSGNIVWDGTIDGEKLSLTATNQSTGGVKILEFDFCRYEGFDAEKREFLNIIE